MIISKLTKDQESKFQKYVQEWKRYGLSTEPINKKNTEKAINFMYDQASLKPPLIIWTESPLANALCKIFLEELIKKTNGENIIGASMEASMGTSMGTSVRASVWASVWASVRDSVRASVWDSVWASVRDSVRASVWDSVGASVGDSVGDFVRASVRASVKASVKASVRASVRDSVWDSVWDSVEASVGAFVWDSIWHSVRDSVFISCYGQHDANWLSFFSFFHNECGLTKETEKLKGLWELCKNSGWILPYENVCFVSNRHYICNLKDDRPHCEDGPSIAYRDGFEIYALNGVRVPKFVVMTPADELNPKLILESKYEGFSNTHEIRSEIVKKIGAKRVMEVLKSKLIEKKSGEELYSSSNIADYVQQGDVLLFPCDNKGNEIHRSINQTFETMDAGTKIRIQNGVFYELYDTSLEGVNIKILRMGNPSVDGEEHVEFVNQECSTIFESILFRNYGKEWKNLDQKNVGLPYKLS